MKKPKYCEFCGTYKAKVYHKRVKKWCCTFEIINCPSRNRFAFQKTEKNFYQKNPICDYCNERPGKHYMKYNNTWRCELSPQKCFSKRKYNDRKFIKMLNNNKSLMCDYGCGQAAKFLFRSAGTVCCSHDARLCSVIKNNLRETIKKNNANRIKKEIKPKLCECGCGKYTTKHENRFIQGHQNYNKPNYYKGRKRPNHSLKLKHRAHHFRGKKSKDIPWNNRHTIKQIKNKYPLFYKMEEPRKDPNDKHIIQYHCKNNKCPNSKEKGGWFTPTTTQVGSRITALEKLECDGSFLYCSEKCKQECTLFRVSSKRLAEQFLNENCEIKENYYTSEEYQTWRKEVLRRSENRCEYCGKPATDAHHTRPQKLEPFFALDPDYGIATCETCHYRKGHKDECSTGRLASIICN
ncbi:MAG: hypothetical protein KGD64_03980 [Candidatus Heimdallarchaeota archaeon]|nr:hypothetical protein [Candidatus Heimdallarchaeota archaeon]